MDSLEAQIIVLKLNSSKPTRQKRSTTSTGSQVIVDHDVVLGGNNMSTGAAALSKTLSTLSTGGSTINIGGSTATFSNVTLLLDKRASNGKFFKPCLTNFVFLVVISTASVIMI